jgi:3-oxoacyl-[acyl-carrier protein] reductase
MLVKDKVILVTGGSSGIGKETALLLSKEGATVIINYYSNEKEAAEVLRSCKNKGVTLKADVSIPSEVSQMFEAIKEKYGKLDVLINNAGIDRPKPFFDLSLRDWDETLKTNLYGVFLCSQEAQKIMPKGARIINTASVRGLDHCGRKGNLVYTVSKAAVISLTKTLAKELAPNILVNAVAPGPTNTKISKLWSEKTKKANIKKSLLKRLMEPSDIANTFLFLCSDMASGITGEVIVADGGYNLQ